ncbi:MAG: DUF1657 domain-containing protein [Betaproteobacteria bacterium]
MTVGEKLHMTLTNLEAAKANLEQFGLDTNDKNAQKMYFEMAEELGRMVQSFKGRVNYVEGQEQQYQVRQQAMQQPPK